MLSISVLEWKNLSSDEREKVEKEEREELLAECCSHGENPTEAVFGLQMDQVERRWRAFPPWERIYRRLRWTSLRIPRFN